MRSRAGPFRGRWLAAPIALGALVLPAPGALAIVEVDTVPAAGAAPGDALGVVAVSGAFALVGAPMHNSGAAGSGAVFVFRQNLYRVWRSDGLLAATDADLSDMFGAAVALDGKWALVGAPMDDEAGLDAGAVYIFERDAAGAWTLADKFVGSDTGAGDEFGSSVAIEGGLIVVGARAADSGGPAGTGAAYVFRLDVHHAWVEEQKITADDAATGDEFGVSVDVSGDWIIVGASQANDTGAISGTAYIFTPDVTKTWVQFDEISPIGHGAGDMLGEAVALRDGLAVIGAPGDDAGAGSAYIFELRQAGWTQAARITPDDPLAGDGFGGAVALAADAAVIGAPKHAHTVSGAGAAYVFEPDVLGVWVQTGEILASDRAMDDEFGSSVGADDDLVIVGAPMDNEFGANSGAAYVFRRDIARSACSETEPNDWQAQSDFVDASICTHLSGKLGAELFLECEPDTFLVLFNKAGERINSNDNSVCAGSGTASGLFGLVKYVVGLPPVTGNGGSGLVDNDDGTLSLRIGVTGRPDGFDGDFNGFFENAGHQQKGRFHMTVTFYLPNGDLAPSPMMLPEGTLITNPAHYDEEFVSGADAFRINYRVPDFVAKADICIDNQILTNTVCRDVDWIVLEGLVPYTEYCMVQVGGISDQCTPTDLLLGWFDKGGAIISKSDTGGPLPAYAELCYIADVLGRAFIGVTGTGDEDFNGLDDALQDPGAGGSVPPCADPPPGHGVCGCYTLILAVPADHTSGPGSPGGGEEPPGPKDHSAILLALDKGDINRDGRTNTADLGIMIGHFGWTRPQ